MVGILDMVGIAGKAAGIYIYAREPSKHQGDQDTEEGVLRTDRRSCHGFFSLSLGRIFVERKE